MTDPDNRMHFRCGDCSTNFSTANDVFPTDAKELSKLEESGRKRGETLALLDKAVDALRRIADAADRKHVGDIARAVLAEIEGGKKDE